MIDVGDPGSSSPVEDGQPGERSSPIRAVIEGDGDDAQCTLCPSDVDDVTLMSRWITASDGSFVALAEMR